MTPGNRLALIGALVLVFIGAALIAVLAIAGELNTSSTSVMTIIGLIVSAVPALIAAGFAKQAATDIRNGVLVDKVTQGTHRALDESGVTEVVNITQKGEATLVAMQALTRLLENSNNTPKSTEGPNNG